MPEAPTLYTRGESILLLVPPGYPGRLSSVVSLVRQQLPGLTVDWTAVREAYLYGRGHQFPVASRRPEAALDEKAKVRCSQDEIEAYLILYPPKPRGQRLQEEEVLSLVRAYGIPDDLVDVQAIRMALLRRSHREAEPIARGRPAVDGNPATVAWTQGLPSDPEGFLHVLQEAADYPEVVLAQVQAGERVGERTPPDAGRPGLSVTGQATPARPGGDSIRLGAGLTLSPDGRGVVAAESGHLRQHGGAHPGARVFPLLCVRDPLQLREWADGVFPGSLIVEGDLEVPFPVRVLGDMEVRGAVIRSSVEVMGSLFVRDGVIQQRLSPVRVGGVVSAAFFERTNVIAHTVHVRRYSLKSRVLALDRIVTPGDASIKGGQLGCMGSLAVGVIGSNDGIATEVLAAHPSLLEPFQETFYGWSDLLNPEDSGSETTTSTPELQAEGRLWESRAEGLEQPDPLEVVVMAEQVNPGVTVRIGSSSRELQNTVGPLEMRYERIGPRGRVSMVRL